MQQYSTETLLNRKSLDPKNLVEVCFYLCLFIVLYFNNVCHCFTVICEKNVFLIVPFMHFSIR